MKSTTILVSTIIISLGIVSCTSQKSEWQGTIEEVDGVTIVNNPINPVAEENGNLRLEESLIIDLEKDELAELGISEIGGFDVDSERNVYLWSYANSENFIYKFNSQGKFLISFGHQGQGPGELEGPSKLRVNEKDEIIVSERGRLKLITFDTNGNLIKETPITPDQDITTLLEDEKILALEANFIQEEGVTQMPIVLRNIELESMLTLHPGYKIPNWVRAKEINGTRTDIAWFPWSISSGNIYIANDIEGYELLVYNFDGTLIRKIRKEHTPVPVQESVKEAVLEAILRPELEQFKLKDKIFFPENMPPFQYFFTDDMGRLYVMTYEHGEEPGEYIYDIFNPEGMFIGRMSLDNSGNEVSAKWGGPFEAKAKRNHLYFLRIKTSGYHELVVYRMIWQ
jgi:hypothetical protein